MLAGRAALRGPLPRLSPRLAGVALRRPRRAFCAAMIAEALNSRSRWNTKIKGSLPPAQTQVPRGTYRHGVTHLGRPSPGEVGIVRESIAQSTQNTTTWSLSVDSHRTGRTVARMIGRILLTLGVLAVTGFVLLVLIGFWDRHEQEITASLSRIYDRYLALQAGFPSNPRARAGIEPERARAAGRGQVATTQTFQQQPKLVGTGAVGSSNQGMSVALSVDGNTAIVGGPGPNNADRDRPASRGPAGTRPSTEK